MSDSSDSSKSEKIYRMERIQISAKVLLSHGEDISLGLSKNLSEEGIFFSTSAPPSIGTVVDLSIETGGPEGAIQVKGVVRWHREQDGKKFGCGIEFLDLESKADHDLYDLLKKAQAGPTSF